MPSLTPEPGPNQYRCAICGGVFDKAWSDEEAKSEHDRDFPGASLESAAVVCDVCYKQVEPATHPEELSKYHAAKIAKLRAEIAQVYIDALTPEQREAIELLVRHYMLYGTPVNPSPAGKN